VRIYYNSYFSSGRRDYPKIKLDLTADEVLVSEPSRQKVLHIYTDLPTDGIFVECYSYPELFAEKVRALSERGRPRDLYDVVNLYRNDRLPEREIVQTVLKEKCAFKGITTSPKEACQNPTMYRACSVKSCFAGGG